MIHGHRCPLRKKLQNDDTRDVGPHKPDHFITEHYGDTYFVERALPHAYNILNHLIQFVAVGWIEIERYVQFLEPWEYEWCISESVQLPERCVACDGKRLQLWNLLLLTRVYIVYIELDAVGRF
jgi:hypothetical protein